MQKLKIDTSKLLTVFSPSGSPQSSAREVENFKERYFTNLKEVDRALLTNLSDKELFRECLEYDYVNSLCQDDDFWKDRFIHYFGQENCKGKPFGRKWKNHYLKISSDLDKFIHNPWIFFSLIEWNCKDNIDKITFKIDEENDNSFLSSSPEWVYNNFYFQNLGNHIILQFPLMEENINNLSTVPRRTVIKEYNGNLGSHFTPYHVFQLIRDFYIEQNLTSSLKFKGITKCENKFLINID